MHTFAWLKGMLLGPVVALLLFLLKLSCPVATGQGCFGDLFYKFVFLPLPFIYKFFPNNPSIVGRHEILFLLLYFAIVGALLGLLVDISKKETI